MDTHQTPSYVLIIDSGPALCDSVTAMIPADRFRVDCASTIHEGSQKMDTLVPDILLIGDHLPDGGSIEFLQNNHQRLADHHIIFMANGPSTDLRKQAFEAGAQHFMEIPFDLNKIPEIFER